LEEEKVKTISLMTKDITNNEDGKLALDKINEKIQENKGLIQIEDRSPPMFEECWEFAKFLLTNVSRTDGDMDIRQRITCLTTSTGFFYRNFCRTP
jgi:protein-tyrosine phosphatase